MSLIILNGFFAGLLLQVALGPVFFFILNIALQKTLADGLFAALAVTLVDYIYISLAILGIGKLLEKKRIKFILGIISSVVLAIFGIVMITSITEVTANTISDGTVNSDYFSSFLSAFILTISSPLTIVFWTSLFATKAIEKQYIKKQLVLFGISAGLATLIFLGLSVIVFSFIKLSTPIIIIKILNTMVGILLMIYGVIRFIKVIKMNNGKLANSEEEIE